MSDVLPPALARAFGIAGRCVAAGPHGSGHIHATFRAEYESDGRRRAYLHQRINGDVFRDPEGLMSNLVRVTDHLAARLAGVEGRERRCLTIVAAADGRPLWRDDRGGLWRTFLAIERARSFDEAPAPSFVRHAARAFGAFAAALADLSPPALVETIPRFHDLAWRRERLEETLREDPHGRAAAVVGEAAALERCCERLAGELGPGADRALPRRIVHNDCKLNNVLFDERSDEALCVIDLDTVMEGTLLADFGHLVRTAAATAPEDERDLQRVDVDLDRFRELARGYREGLGSLLSDAERRALPAAGVRMALEDAIRFLTDHVAGDVYFRIRREGHNLDRARAQRHLAERLLERLPETRRAFDGAA